MRHRQHRRDQRHRQRRMRTFWNFSANGKRTKELGRIRWNWIVRRTRARRRLGRAARTDTPIDVPHPTPRVFEVRPARPIVRPIRHAWAMVVEQERHVSKRLLWLLLWLILLYAPTVGWAQPTDSGVPWTQLPAEEQQVLRGFQKTWEDLPADRRERLRAGAQQWARMSEAERGQALDSFRQWKRMGPDAQARTREQFRKFRALPPEERQALRRARKYFRGLPENERRALREQWRQMSQEERRAFRREQKLPPGRP